MGAEEQQVQRETLPNSCLQCPNPVHKRQEGCEWTGTRLVALPSVTTTR